MNRILVVLLVLACSPVAAAQASLVARGSVEQVQVTGAKPGRDADAEAARRRGRAAARRARSAAPCSAGVKPAAATASRGKRVRVLPNRSAPPSTKGYAQQIPTSGYGYLTHARRDEARDRRPPARAARARTRRWSSTRATATPTRTARESSISPIANLLGYAVVDVNMRGTGCSGGAFDYFEPLQGLDGYDVIETVARQPWVARHKVGMMGVSYGGISQLFVAADAAAEPGRDHAAVGDRQHGDDALPGRDPQHRLRALVGEGPRRTTRKPASRDRRPGVGAEAHPGRRQDLQGQPGAARRGGRPDREDASATATTCPKVADPLAPVTFVHKINVPMFLACQWTDEQTGGHCPTLAEHFTGTTRKWFTFTNGTHIDSLDPATFNRWFDFLELYVARRAPQLPAGTARARADDLQDRHRRRRRQPAATTRSRRSRRYDGGARRVRGAAAGADPVRQRRGQVAGAPGRGLRAVVRALPAAGHDRALVVPRRRAGRSPTRSRRRRASDTFTWSRARAAARPSFTGNTGAGTNGLWTATPSYDWRRTRPAPRCRT